MLNIKYLRRGMLGLGQTLQMLTLKFNINVWI